MVNFGSERFQCSHEPEWLVTNGIGGYASGSISGKLYSRYHGLLIAALKPPLSRTLLLSKFDEHVIYDVLPYPHEANDCVTNKLDATSLKHLESFRLEGTIPTWTFRFADAALEKQVWMEYGENITYIRYIRTRATLPLTLNIRAIANYRDSHFNTHSPEWADSIKLSLLNNGVQLMPFDSAVPLYLTSNTATFRPNLEWIRGYYLELEGARGLDAIDDNFSPGSFEVTLHPGSSVTFVANTRINDQIVVNNAHDRYEARQAKLIALSGQDKTHWQEQLVLAADQFIVSRPLPDNPNSLTVLAGYPWFSDWGRGTMIALPGLTLATGRFDIAANILRTFARFVDQGMLPNRFPDEGEHPEYNTVDATLWYFQAIRQYFEATRDLDFLRELYPILVDIIAWHERGMRFNIHVDPVDGLLYAGEPDVQLTWIDVKIHTRFLPIEHLYESESTLWLPAFLALLQGVELPKGSSRRVRESKSKLTRFGTTRF